jgi:stage V sporulation protein AE
MLLLLQRKGEIKMEYFYAFIIGGAICVIGQILIDTTKLTAPRILVIFIVAGAILTGLGIYEPLVKLANNGATVPLPGFGYALAKGAMDGAKDGFLAAISGGIKDTAAGVAAAVTFGYAIALVFSPKSKR